MVAELLATIFFNFFCIRCCNVYEIMYNGHINKRGKPHKPKPQRNLKMTTQFFKFDARKTFNEYKATNGDEYMICKIQKKWYKVVVNGQTFEDYSLVSLEKAKEAVQKINAIEEAAAEEEAAEEEAAETAMDDQADKPLLTLTNRSLFVSKKPMPFTEKKEDAASVYKCYLAGIKEPSSQAANQSIYAEIDSIGQLDPIFTLLEYHVKRIAAKSRILDDAIESGRLISMTGSGDDVVFGILADKAEYELVTSEQAIEILSQ